MTWGDPKKPRRELLWLQEGQKCRWCGKPTRLIDEQTWDQATIDHILPRYKGGGNEESNLCSACRLCNNRRSHEDARGLPDGHLLGNYFPSDPKPTTNDSHGRVVLTGDEKKAIMTGQPLRVIPKSKKVEDVLKEQRDQALSALSVARVQRDDARGQLELLRREHKVREIVVRELDEQVKMMSVWRLIRLKLSALITPK